MKYFLLFPIILLCFQACSTVDTEPTRNDIFYQSLTGKWEATDVDGEYGYLHFTKDRHVDIFFEGTSFSELIANGSGSLQYRVNTDRDPITLEISFYTFFAQKIKSLGAIIEFIDKDTLKIAMAFDESNEIFYPESFDNTEMVDSVVLTRVKGEVLK